VMEILTYHPEVVLVTKQLIMVGLDATNIRGILWENMM